MPVALLQENVLRELFEANVFKLLVCEGLITAELIAKIHSWRHSGFHVYAGRTITQKEDAVRVGLYIVCPPGSSSRLQFAEVGLLKYLAKGSVANETEWIKLRRKSWAALSGIPFQPIDSFLLPIFGSRALFLSQ